MNCQRFQESFAEAHDGLLPPADAAALRAHLADCPACRREWDLFQQTLQTLDRLPAPPTPSTRMRAAFEASLAAEIEAETKSAAPSENTLAGSRTSHTSPAPKARPSLWAALNRTLAHLIPAQPAFQAACALLLLGGGIVIGHRITAPADDATRQELASLRTQVSSMGQLVAYSLAQQQQPVGTRLQTVARTRQNALHADATVSPATLSVLVNSLAFDASTNVRLAALEALYEHADQPLARQAVLSALPRERSPLVQIAMIDFVASLGDPGAEAVLESLCRDSATTPEVRSAASRMLVAQKLRSNAGQPPPKRLDRKNTL